MLRAAIYILVLFLSVASIVLFVRSLVKKITKKSNIVRIVYLVFSVMMFVLTGLEIVELDWNLLVIYPALIGSAIFMIAGLIIVNNKKMAKTGHYHIASVLLAVLVPVMVFVIPYGHDVYVLSKCELLLEYNYQSGWVTSENTYIAVVNNKPVTVTLQPEYVHREADYIVRYGEMNSYRIDYGDDGTCIFETLSGNAAYEDRVYAIAELAKGKYENVDSIYLYYVPELDSAAVDVFAGKGDLMERSYDMYYYGNTLVAIYPSGNIEKITYYGR